MEGIVQRDHDHRNVVVVVQESLKTEQVIVLEDSEGEFLQCEPTYKDPPRRVRLVEDPQVIDDLREQLEAAEQTLATARSREAQGLQEALRSQAAELREAHQAEVTAWTQRRKELGRGGRRTVSI